ncbi:MAG: branched-chain amino acid ABC transporter permease [Clostridia bacterium]|nr:branched-chain amino acid ABC transporter permease [Clostridia bacterium]
MNILALQSLLDGLMMGGVYALAALGLSLIFGVLKITNFAHGAMMTIGMYLVYAMSIGFGLNPYAAMPIAMAVMFLIGFLIQRFPIHSIEHAPAHNQLLLTLGLAYVFENTILVIFTPNYKTLSVRGFEKALHLGVLTFAPARLVAFCVVIVVTAGVYALLYRTHVGSNIRASAQNDIGARLMGINVRNTRAIAFGIGAVCTGIAGGLLTPIMSFYPTLGESFQLKCFVISVLGGMGNLWGALLSGLLIGIIESMSGYYLGGSWSELLIYGIFILILFVRPMGLFGRRNRREN